MIWYIETEEQILGLPVDQCRRWVYYFETKSDMLKWKKRLNDGIFPEKYVVGSGVATFKDGILYPFGS